MERERKPLRIPANFFDGDIGARVEAKVNKLIAALELPDDPDRDQLTDASMAIELAFTVFLARYCFGVEHFAQGIKMILGHVMGDAQSIIAENSRDA